MNASVAFAKLGRCPGCTRAVCEWEWKLDVRSADPDHVTLIVRQRTEAVTVQVASLSRNGY